MASTFYLIVHRAADNTPTSVKTVDNMEAAEKYLGGVARNAMKFDMTIASRSTSGITFADGKSVTVAPIE
jgi:hypothetical protein